jgi:ribosomal protein S18 acetylase RimI-like enzyme
MLTYRTFRNTDPPKLASIWRSRAGQQALAQPISVDLLEQYVFAKLYFDYHGLILACDDGEAVGFAHAGFGPDDQEGGVCTEMGTTCLVLTRADCRKAELATGLLEQSEAYLRRQGAKVIYGGGIRPLNAFYFGLYGGSEMPGVLDTDRVAQGAYLARGYEEIDRTLVMQRDLSTFEAVVDRRQMQIRRQMVVEVAIDPPSRTWWEACVLGEFDLTRFALVPRGGGPPAAIATFRSMELTDSSSPGHIMALIDLVVAEAYRRRGLAVFLLSEAFRQFARQGITTIEAQAMQHNVAALGMYRKLNFQQIDQGSVFRKGEGGGRKAEG